MVAGAAVLTLAPLAAVLAVRAVRALDVALKTCKWMQGPIKQYVSIAWTEPNILLSIRGHT